MITKSSRIKKLIFNEKYHDNCHDYLKPANLELYAIPKYKKLLYQIKEKIPKINICADTADNLYADIIVCDQHAAIISHSNDIFYVLATYALNACVAVVMYNSKYKIGCMTHFDGLPAYLAQSARAEGLDIDFDPVTENVKILLDKIYCLAESIGRTDSRIDSIIDIDYYLIGGIFGMSEVMINDIISCIKKMDKTKFKFVFKGRNILGPENQSRNICLNTKTGAITYFDYGANSEFYRDFRNSTGQAMNVLKAPNISDKYLDITYEPTMSV